MKEFIGESNTYDLERDQLYEDFGNYSHQLIDMIRTRVFGEDFKEIMDMVLSFEYSPANRLAYEDREKQLEMCSQSFGSFETLSGELTIYLRKVQNRYDDWMAPKLFESRQKVITEKNKWYVAKMITKAEVKFTNDEIKQQFLIDNKDQNRLWQDFIDHVERSVVLIKGITKDLDKRSMILMSLRKPQN